MPNWLAAIWLHHSMWPSLSSSTTPLGVACRAARISCKRLWLSCSLASLWRSKRRARSAASPHMPRMEGAVAKSPVRSHRSTRAPRDKSHTNQAHAATAAPRAAPQGPARHQPKAPPASCQVRKNTKRQNMWDAQLSQKYAQPREGRFHGPRLRPANSSAPRSHAPGKPCAQPWWCAPLRPLGLLRRAITPGVGRSGGNPRPAPSPPWPLRHPGPRADA